MAFHREFEDRTGQSRRCTRDSRKIRIESPLLAVTSSILFYVLHPADKLPSLYDKCLNFDPFFPLKPLSILERFIKLDNSIVIIHRQSKYRPTYHDHRLSKARFSLGGRRTLRGGHHFGSVLPDIYTVSQFHEMRLSSLGKKSFFYSNDRF